ncbi:hypothetical protein [Erwinia sp. SLM-02]|uniref:hypothetical protein n=1 Tax=Erwinia sp. SLM-02 TaxID=3020057 RepID=UPI0030801C6A
MIDAIDKAAGLSPDDALFSARRFRAEFVEGAEACRRSVLMPENDLGLNAALRLALARRIAALNNDLPLIAEYDALLADTQPDDSLQALAAGESALAEPLATLAHHSDLITRTPDRADADAIRRLEQAGLNNPQIVALSELIAFVNFQTRVTAGLRLMRSA